MGIEALRWFKDLILRLKGFLLDPLCTMMVAFEDGRPACGASRGSCLIPKGGEGGGLEG